MLEESNWPALHSTPPIFWVFLPCVWNTVYGIKMHITEIFPITLKGHIDSSVYQVGTQQRAAWDVNTGNYREGELQHVYLYLFCSLSVHFLPSVIYQCNILATDMRYIFSPLMACDELTFLFPSSHSSLFLDFSRLSLPLCQHTQPQTSSTRLGNEH